MIKSHQIMCVGPLLAPSYEALAHLWNEASLSLSYSYYFGRGSSELGPLPSSCIRSTRYSNRLHDFSVTFCTCCKDVYVNSFFPHTARHGNSLPAEHFPFTYDLNGSTCRVNEYFFPWGFSIQLSTKIFTFSSFSCNFIPRSGSSALHGLTPNLKELARHQGLLATE